MPLKFKKPLIYLITNGKSTTATNPNTRDFSQLIRLVEAAVAADIDLIQLREKNLHAAMLYKLAERAAGLTRGSQTRLLVNDRADVASSAHADGVHLTSTSIDTSVVRRMFGNDFLIGVSTHVSNEVIVAKNEGADFVVFGPVFATPSKQESGEPVGLDALKDVASMVAPFPVLPLGGVSLEQVSDCFKAGAAGIAGIRLFEDWSKLSAVVTRIREEFLKAEDA
jgi:thiamine-phosphate pyrophosphorylase